jgi:hypothetical protein
MKKSLPVAALLGITAVLALLGASAANAAPPTALPPGQGLFAIDCDAHGSQLWSFTPDGAATPVGTASGVSGSCAGGGQTSPIDGLSYFIYYPGGPVSALATVDLTTGVITTIANISGDTSGAWQFFITNSGAAFITNSNTLYSIDLATAVTTLVGAMSPANDDAVGYDSLTDTIYAFDRSDTIAIYTIDRTTGAGTDTGLGGTWPVATCLAGGTDVGSPDGVAFDSAGFAWIQSDSCDSNIMAVDMTDGSSTMMGELFDATATLYPTAPNDFYSETFLISAAPPVTPPVTPAAPGLAATGIDTTMVAAVGGVGAVAALLGVALLVRSRRIASSR